MSVMADIAVIFHWPASELWNMTIDELLDWHDQAVERAKMLTGG